MILPALPCMLGLYSAPHPNILICILIVSGRIKTNRKERNFRRAREPRTVHAKYAFIAHMNAMPRTNAANVAADFFVSVMPRISGIRSDAAM